MKKIHDSTLQKTKRNISTNTAFKRNGTQEEISYVITKIVGNGSFGIVNQAKLCETGEVVAIKKVFYDKLYKNRELPITRRLDHCNIVKLLYFFYTSGVRRDETYLNLVLEYIPGTVNHVCRQYAKSTQPIPAIFIKLYMYQLFRSVAYIHSQGICHRDIKPDNLLLDKESGILKLCDFGSAKELVKGERNVSYICSRLYRAPELLFGSVDYTDTVDLWSTGCVFGELIIGKPLFSGVTAVDQLVEIIRILGTPTPAQIKAMNPNYAEFEYPQIKSRSWTKVFRERASYEAIDLVSKLLEYTPASRMTPLQACAHVFFDELREPAKKLPNGREMPPLFNFTEAELNIQPSLNAKLVPSYRKHSTSYQGSKGTEKSLQAVGSTSAFRNGSKKEVESVVTT